jgi:hypothetical protein
MADMKRTINRSTVLLTLSLFIGDLLSRYLFEMIYILENRVARQMKKGKEAKGFKPAKQTAGEDSRFVCLWHGFK